MGAIEAIIFDCFGVIYPQAGIPFFERYKASLARNPQAWADLVTKIDLGQITRQEFYLAQEKITGVPARSAMDEIDSQMNVDRNLVALIKKLKPQYKIGFLSNACKEEIEPVFRDKIDWLFDSMAVSYEVGAIKPDAKMFLVSAQRLGVEPEKCLFVDDSQTNIDAAQSLGMKTLLYPTFGKIPAELSNLAA